MNFRIWFLSTPVAILWSKGEQLAETLFVVWLMDQEDIREEYFADAAKSGLITKDIVVKCHEHLNSGHILDARMSRSAQAFLYNIQHRHECVYVLTSRATHPWSPIPALILPSLIN